MKERNSLVFTSVKSYLTVIGPMYSLNLLLLLIMVQNETLYPAIWQTLNGNCITREWNIELSTVYVTHSTTRWSESPDELWENVLVLDWVEWSYCTWPSQRSMRGALSRLALMSLLWSSLPSKYIHGQQCSHGMGWPHTSLANRAMSTPLINRAASWTPRVSRLSICRNKHSCFEIVQMKEQQYPQSPTKSIPVNREQSTEQAQAAHSLSLPTHKSWQPNPANTQIQQAEPTQSICHIAQSQADRADTQTTKTKADSSCGWFTHITISLVQNKCSAAVYSQFNKKKKVCKPSTHSKQLSHSQSSKEMQRLFLQS